MPSGRALRIDGSECYQAPIRIAREGQKNHYGEFDNIGNLPAVQSVG